MEDTPLANDIRIAEAHFLDSLMERDVQDQRPTGKPLSMRQRRTEHRPGIRATKRTGGAP